jgi:uncharacterized paraquat-inducible protein A
MAEIPAAAYIVVGIVMAVASIALGLTFFIYVGLIFLVWGLGKLSYRRLGNKGEPVHAPKIQTHRQHIVRCPHCQNIVHLNDNFCSRCGARKLS